MPPVVTRLTTKGQFTLPRRLREAIGVKPGDYIALTLTPQGVVVTAAEVSAKQPGESELFELVRSIGEQLEAQGITEEEQLDEMIEEAKRKAFELHCGRPPS